MRLCFLDKTRECNQHCVAWRAGAGGLIDPCCFLLKSLKNMDDLLTGKVKAVVYPAGAPPPEIS